MLECERQLDAIPYMRSSLRDDLAEVHADSKLHATIIGDARVSRLQRLLDTDRRLDGIYDAGELREKLIAWCVHHAAALLSDQLGDDFPVGGERLYRSDVVGAHQATIAFDSGAQDCGQSPLDVRDSLSRGAQSSP